MDSDLIIKKIYINDYIINTTLLKNSISKLLINTLSNKFYKTNKIDYKINNILNKIDNIFTETGSGDKIFNLSYQPYNQYNITHNYNNNNFNKKWIIPIINETKTLNHNVVKVKNFDYYNTTDLLIEKVDEENYRYIESEIDINTKDNFFQDENIINYNIEHINLLDNKIAIELEVLSNNEHIYNFNDPDNIISSKTSNKVIRTKTNENENLYIIKSDGTLDNSDIKGIKKINKKIVESFYEVHNILINENINIKQFLILNPLKLIHTNYNITLGNTISYLNEIMTTTYFNINSIINNYSDNLDTLNLEMNGTQIDYLIINKEEITNQYNNEDNFIFDYLKIIKNLDMFEDKIYSIRVLKHIYNIFGYDLNKIPHCYILYLQNILNNNINKYINNNKSVLTYLINKFKFYKSTFTNIIPKNIQTICDLYNIDNIIYNEDEPIYNILHNNTHDNGLLYYLNIYNTTYLTDKTNNNFKLITNNLKDISINCNYRIVKMYDLQEDYDNDITKFIGFDFSLDNYLIEYDDLIYNLQQSSSETYKFKNSIYKQNKKHLSDSDKSNIKPVKSESILTIKNFIENNKLYIYNLLLNTYDINIVFTKFILLYYKNKKYFQIPYKIIEDDNIITIDNILYKYENNSLIKINKDLNDLQEEIAFNCNNIDNIEKNNIDNLNKFYKHLNNFDKTQHNIHISNLINIYEKDNNFKNFLITKSTSYVKSQLYFKNIEKIIYPINNYNQSILIDYLLNYKIANITFTNLSENLLLDEISNSIYNTDYIKQIKTVSDKIDKSSGKNLWNYIHHYVNEYELLTNVIVDGAKYNRAYYKLWEILLDNKIIDKPDFRYIALAEAPGNFVKCVKNLKSHDWDDFVICTLLDDSDTINQGKFFDVFKNYIYAHPKGNLKIKGDNNFKGNLTNTIDITTFIKYIETNNLQADLITADGGIKKDTDIDYLLEEYNHLPLFLGEIITAIFTQKLGGTFILKMYDIVYINSINLITLLSSFYTNVYITKPYSSRPCNTEKYIVCSNFTSIDNSNKKKLLSNLLSILSNLNNLNNSSESYKYFDIFEKLSINEQNKSKIIEFNNSIIVKTQLLHLQDIYDIIQKNDKKQLNLIKTYFGPKRNYNIKNILSSEDNIDKGYFIKKIENCIILALYMKLVNQPLKSEYIDYYSLIKNMKHSVLNTNVYPPHFKEIYEINKEENKSIQVDKINKFIKQYCIAFEKPGVHKIIDYYILRTVEYFMLNDNIINLNHYVINKLRDNKTNLNSLYVYLKELCKTTDITKLFYLQDSVVISLIKNFQNSIRSYLGYYLCKYTYIPIYPKYKSLDNVKDQVEQYGILYKSHYICYYSGDKFDMEEFDDFMGDSIFRSNNISIFDEVNSTTNNVITVVSKSYNNDLSIEENICSFILNKFTLDNIIKLDILNKLQYITNSIILDDIKQSIKTNYAGFIDFLSKKYEKSLQKTDTNKGHTYKYKDKSYKYFKLESKHLEEGDIIINSKIKKIIDNLNKNKTLLTVDQSIKNKEHLLIKTIYDLLLSTYFTNTYFNTIIYTLVQIANNKGITFENIYNTYINFEKDLIESIFKNSLDLFNIFKNGLLQNYLLPIKFPPFTNANSTTNITIDNIIELNNNQSITDILDIHIDKKKSNWDPNKQWIVSSKNNKEIIEKKFNRLNESKNVLEFLQNLPYINRKSYTEIYILLKENKLNNTMITNLKLDLSMYLSKTEFKESCEIFNKEIIDNFTICSKINIENSIIDNRVDLINKSLLNYKNNLSLFTPLYDSTPPLLYNSKEIYLYNCIKYLYLYVFEPESQYIGKKRIYDNNICLYTEQTKAYIINSINELPKNDIIELYKNTFNLNYKIVNNADFVGKNTLDHSFISLIYNTVYKIDNMYIDLFYTSIKLFYLNQELTITGVDSDIFKNIIMRYYNDPITNIIMFLEIYKTQFIEFIQSTNLHNSYDFNSIIKNIYETKDTELFKIINNVTTTNFRSINDNLIVQIKIYSKTLKNYNIILQEDFTIKDIILLINNLKKSLSYITNIANLNIINDLKNNKYKEIKNQYVLYEYNTLIELVQQSNYDYNLSEFDNEDFDYIQIVFNDILEDFNYNFNNIYSLNETITKYVLLLKLYKIINNCIDKLDNPYNFNVNPNLKNKFYIFENKIEQTKLNSTVFDLDEFSNTNKKYLNLFISILSNIINNITNYSSVINKLNPDKYNTDESITYDINDYNDVVETYAEGLMGDEEEME